MDPVELHTDVDMSFKYFRNGGARGRLAVAGIVTSPYLASPCDDAENVFTFIIVEISHMVEYILGYYYHWTR